MLQRRRRISVYLVSGFFFKEKGLEIEADLCLGSNTNVEKKKLEYFMLRSIKGVLVIFW